jgi:hypothetical protein
VESCPFEDHGKSAPRQLPTEHSQRIYLNQGFMLPINGVKMPGLMVVIVEANCNPEESRNFRHLALNAIPLSI